jgi:hypothetical protein
MIWPLKLVNYKWKNSQGHSEASSSKFVYVIGWFEQPSDKCLFVLNNGEVFN